MESDALQPKLEEAQSALKSALDVACGVDVSKVDTGELIRIEETLALASQAAKEAVSMRLHRRNQRARSGHDGPESAPADSETASLETEQDVGHRIFEDVRGKRWHAFAVQNADVLADRAGLPDLFRQGWLVFESEHELRRIAPIPPNWAEMSSDELRELCHHAKGSPRRTGSLPTPGNPSGTPDDRKS